MEFMFPNTITPSELTSIFDSPSILIKKGEEPDVSITTLEDSTLSIEAVLNVLELLPKSYTLEVEGIMSPWISI